MQIYAVIKTSGKEYRVTPGKIVKFDRMDVEIGETIVFDEVCELVNGDQTATGKPLVVGARVSAQVLKHGQEKGIIVFRMKRRRIYQDKFDRPQEFTSLIIKEIIFGDAVFGKNQVDPKKIKKAKAIEAKKARAAIAQQPKPQPPPVKPEPKIIDIPDTKAPVEKTPPPQIHSQKTKKHNNTSMRVVAIIALLVLLALIGFYWMDKNSSPASGIEPPAVDIRLQQTGDVDSPIAPTKPPK